MSEGFRKFFSKNYLSLILIAVFLLLAYLLYYNSFNAPWEGDEGEYAYSAWLIERGEVPYYYSFLQKPPMIIYAYLVAHIIRPFAIWPPRLLAFIFTLTSCLLLAVTARRLYGTRAGWAALYVAAPLLSYWRLGALAANTEKFMLVPLTGLLALFAFRHRTETPWTYLAAGSLAALAILYKPIALPPVALLIIYWLGINWYESRDVRGLARSTGLVMTAGLGTAFLVFSYFIFNGAFFEMWQQIYVFNVSYAKSTLNYFPRFFFQYWLIILFAFWPLALVALASFYFRFKLIGLWWALFLVSLLFIMTTRIGHYYLLLMPFWVLIVAGVVSGFREKIADKAWVDVYLIGLIAFIWVIFGAVISGQFWLDPASLNKFIYGHNNNFSEAMLMAEKVKEITGPDERIFVAGAEPQIYYFSRRVSVSRLNVTWPLYLDTPWRDRYQALVLQDLRTGRPPVIVLPLGNSALWAGTSTSAAFIDFLEKELEDNYHFVGGTISKFEHGKYLGPQWVDPGRVTTSSLLLFVRRPEGDHAEDPYIFRRYR